ncbi:MAG: DUF2231 domain-containing protein [Lacunisphaera sp.]
MDTGFWTKLHGAATHFPIALTLCSGVFDGAGFALANRPIGRDLNAAGYWAMILGALGSVPAVISGLIMTKGVVLGHGVVRMHHLFAWPGFALLVALATWRVMLGRQATRSTFIGYLAGVVVAAGLVSAAGYWGGEMLIAR